MRTRTTATIGLAFVLVVLAVLVVVGVTGGNGETAEQIRTALLAVRLAESPIVLAVGGAAIGIGLGIVVGAIDAYERVTR